MLVLYLWVKLKYLFFAPLETQLTKYNTEKDILVQQVETLLKEKGDLELKIKENEKKIEQLEAAHVELEKKYQELSEITDEQDSGLLSRETEVFALKHEVRFFYFV